MANPHHLALIKQGAVYWNFWREQYPAVLPDLSSADLKGAYLVGANLKGVNFFKANLEAANLAQANIEGAYFRGANLEGATMPNGRCHQNE